MASTGSYDPKTDTHTVETDNPAEIEKLIAGGWTEVVDPSK